MRRSSIVSSIRKLERMRNLLLIPILSRNAAAPLVFTYIIKLLVKLSIDAIANVRPTPKTLAENRSAQAIVKCQRVLGTGESSMRMAYVYSAKRTTPSSRSQSIFRSQHSLSYCTHSRIGPPTNTQND